MHAFVVSGPGRYGVEEVDAPDAGPGEVLVAPAAVGLCGSDIELVNGDRPAEYRRYPVIPGHEWAGRVAGLGPGVRGLEVGQPVVAEGVRPCGSCDRCAEGRANLCAGPYAETGFTHPGALAQLLTVPAAALHPLPDRVPIEPAALIEPAACVANALLELGLPDAGSRLAVVGDGPLGLLALLLLRLSSPRELVLAGRRRDRARHAPAGVNVLIDADGGEPELRARFDLVVEATNTPDGAACALRLARRGGAVALLGISGRGRPALDPDTISLGQLRVQGSFAASPAAWRWTVARYADAQLDPSPLITHRYPLALTEEAMATLGDPGLGAVKVLVNP